MTRAIKTTLGRLGRLIAPLGALALTATLVACAAPTRQTALVPQITTEAGLIDAGSPLFRAISIGPVTGGRSTTAISAPQVSTGDFRAALETALKLRDMFNAANPSFSLEATIEEIDQPSLQINFETTSTIFYRLRDASSGAIVHEERVTKPFTAPFLESIVRLERIRIATEGSVKENIATFLDNLVARSNTAPYAFISAPVAPAEPEAEPEAAPEGAAAPATAGEAAAPGVDAYAGPELQGGDATSAPTEETSAAAAAVEG